jgi:hypothetical protein
LCGETFIFLFVVVVWFMLKNCVDLKCSVCGCVVVPSVNGFVSEKGEVFCCDCYWNT